MKIENERLKKNYEIALNTIYEVMGKKEVKQQMRKVIDVRISPRAVSRHGVCRYINGGCIIEVSKYLFECSDYEMINTLIHEVLHTFKDAKGHGTMWQWYANQINKNTDYKITRCRDIEREEKNYKFNIICNGCGNKIKRYRISNKMRIWISNNKCFCRRCGSHSLRIDTL